MSRRWYDVDYTIAQVQMGNALRPMIEPKESAHRRQIWRDDLYIWQRGELPVASVMIVVLMSVHNEQGRLTPSLDGKREGTVCASGILFGSATAPVSIKRAFCDPMS